MSNLKTGNLTVSTHSRPKAAGCQIRFIAVQKLVSTHSRPKAAGGSTLALFTTQTQFQHTAARRRLVVEFYE